MIYLDAAATTMQKPEAVARAAAYAINHMASPGRGGHRPAMLAAETAFQCREVVADLFHVSEPDNVVFTLNATHALNIAIKTLVKPGDRVVISGYEHNAVTRPLYAMDGVEVAIATAPLFDQATMVEAFRTAITPDTKCVICTHVSNVFGYILPVEAIANLCHQRGVPLIVDASQSAGVLEVNMERLGADFIAMPGHKGLYGPQGTGILLCGRDATPLLIGGTGSLSAQQEMPDFLPDRLEAGTHNITGIAGLLEGVRFVRGRGVNRIFDHERRLIEALCRGLHRLSGVKVFSLTGQVAQAGVLSFYVEGRDCEVVGEELGNQGFALRAGLHCAPTAHGSAGTLESGTIRASVSAFNTLAEVQQLVTAVGNLT